MSGDPIELDWDRLRRCRARVPRHVVFRDLVSETVLLNIETGLYHGMDAVGSRFFAALCESDTVAAAVDALAEEFEATLEQLRADMVDFCIDLVDRGLIELDAPHDQGR